MDLEVVQVFLAMLFKLFEGSLIVLSTGLGGIVLHKLAIKFHLNNEAQLKEGLDYALSNAVHGAEGWANAHETEITGSAKMDEAIKIARMLLADPTFKSITDEQLKKLIEAKLTMTINNPNDIAVSNVAAMSVPNSIEIAKALKAELAKP